MRIAYIINQYPKVSHTFIRREILALEQQGVEILRIAMRGWDSEIVDGEDVAERQRTRYVLRDGPIPLIVSTIRMLFIRPASFWRSIKLSWKMSRRAERPILIHLIYLMEACRIAYWLARDPVAHIHAHFGTNAAEVAMLTSFLGGQQWSFTVHGPEEFDKASLLGLAEKIVRCAFAVTVSSFGRSQLFRLVDHTFWHKIHVVHCGIDEGFIANADTALLPSNRSLICVGRLCEQKGQLLLIDAARRLFEEGIEFEVVLAGDGELRQKVEDLIAKYDLRKNIRITGWISGAQVRSEILAARALVLPSFAEGLPVVLMEAMCLRRPVISTYVAGIPELVVSGENGWLIPAGDVASLAKAMRACLSASVSTLNLMGDCAHRRVVSDHNSREEAIKLSSYFRKYSK